MQKIQTLKYPPSIIFGEGASGELPGKIPPKGRNVLLVTGKSIARSEYLKSLLSGLANFAVTHVDDIGVEAPLHDVQRLIEKGRETNADTVVAVGGGTVIDAAKAAAAIIPFAGDCSDYFYGRTAIASKGLFFAALPTTAGSGSEITANAVLLDPEKKIKQSIRHPLMVPDLAIVDPLLTLSVPPSVTASSGMDAMVQAIEAYTSVSANAVTQALSEKSVELLLNRLPDAFHNGADIEARTAVAEGSLLSAMSFSQSGLGAAHGLAHPIGSILALPHGLVCSILISHVLEWNSLSCGGLYDSLARKCGLADRSELIAKICNISAEMGIPGSFAGHRIDEAQKQFIIRNCRSRSMQTNPRPMSDDDIASMIDRLFS